MLKDDTTSNYNSGPARSARGAAARVRQRIEEMGEGYWRIGDFSDLPPAAVAQALSRLSRARKLQRVGKGLYYSPRKTAFGESRPSQEKILAQSLRQPLFAAGLTAANLLGFTTQTPSRREYATPANALNPDAIARANIKVYTRRPEIWTKLPAEDAALLNFLRARAKTSDLASLETKQRLLRLMREPGRYARLYQAVATEPPRVRAMLGAIGQEIGAQTELLDSLRESLNPLSRFDFGALQGLKYAREWQARF